MAFQMFLFDRCSRIPHSFASRDRMRFSIVFSAKEKKEYEFCKYGKNNDIGVDPGFGVFCFHGILCSCSAR